MTEGEQTGIGGNRLNTLTHLAYVGLHGRNRQADVENLIRTEGEQRLHRITHVPEFGLTRFGVGEYRVDRQALF